MIKNALDYEGLKYYDGKAKDYVDEKVSALDSDKVDKTTVASSSTLGLVKSGTDITVDASGNVSVNDNSHKHTVSNISDLTATAAELNIMDGVTATTTELNYVNGVTSNIQTQLKAKAPLASPTLTGTPKAPTATAGTNTTQIATTAFVQTAVSSLVNGAPETLNTLNELSDALGDDPNFATTIATQLGNKVDKVDGKGLSTNDYTTADKTKLDATNVAYGTCTTAAATATKVVTISGNTNWKLVAGSMIAIKFTYTNTAQNPMFNVNSTGAKSIWYNTALITTGSLGYAGTANRIANYIYDGTQYVFIGWSIDSNTTYSNASLGQGYGTCATAEATVAKVVTLSSYALITGGIVAVKFTYAVPANATMNINSKGTKNIFYRGSAITTNVIKAGDIGVFIYDGTQYHLLTVDRDDNTNTDTKVTQTVKTDNANYPLLLAPSGQTATATATACFDSGVTLNPSTNTIVANISGNAATATSATSATNSTNVYSTLTNPTSATNYFLPFHATASSANKQLLNNNGIFYRTLEGTASANGYGILCLGNNTASATAGNKYGSIMAYGTGAYYTQLTFNNSTANRTIAFPNANGTVALTSNPSNISPTTASTYDLGTSALPWKYNYTKGCEIYGEASKSYGYLRAYTVGTTDTVGETRLTLGNNVASGTASNACGAIYAFGNGSYYTKLAFGTQTANRTITFPNATGTVALTSSTAPTAHASTATTYGIGTDANYGHVKLSDSYTTSGGAASAGVAASSKAVVDAYNEIKNNLNIFPDYAGGITLYETDNIPNRDSTFSIIIPETAYYSAFVSTGDTNTRPFMRLSVNSSIIFQGYNASGNYMYLQSPLFLFKKGTVVVFYMEGSVRNINKTPISTEIWKK